MRKHSIATIVSTVAAMAGLPLLAQQATAAPSSGILGQISIHFGHDNPPPPAPAPMGWGDDQRHELRHVYWELEHADRDYDGHRHEAIEQIRKAAEVLGMDLHGEGYGAGEGEGEPQHWSDHRLREARDKLADLSNRSAGREHDHLDRAVHELDRALESR